MHSLVQVAEGSNFTGTDSLMPPTLLKTSNGLNVNTGQKVKLLAEYKYGTNLDIATFSLSK